MPERWIKLRLHRKHRKIAVLATLLDIPPVEALSIAIDWFRLIDSDPTMSKHAFKPAEIAAMLDCDKDVAAAFADRSVQWLTTSGEGLLRIQGARKWISERHLSRERVTRHRRNKNALDKTREDADETQNDKTELTEKSSILSDSTAKSVRIQAEVIRVADTIGIAQNNKRVFLNFVLNTPNGYGILRRILVNAKAQNLAAVDMPKYVFKAMKDEATRKH